MHKDIQHPLYYKGTAFSKEEREKYELQGLIPEVVHTLKQQIQIEYEKLNLLEDNFLKSKYLQQLYNSNRTLYFALIENHIKELLPIIYTPTIAKSVTRFSESYLNTTDTLYLDSSYPDEIESKLKNASKNLEDIDLMVISDGEGVLGIGDWGINGVMISIGKLCVYTVAAGINPNRVLSVIIDNGTNREELLTSSIYLGKKEKRLVGEEYLKFIDKFVSVSKNLYPNVLFHWEDFGRENAKVILDRYKNKITSFNDDIQGTGIMIVSAVNAVLKVTKTVFSQQKFLIYGAGTAGIGVAEQIKNEMIFSGISYEDAVSRIYLVDKNGLVVKGDTSLTDGQKEFAKNMMNTMDLVEIVKVVRPSFLIGTSGQANAFSKEVIEEMKNVTDRPAIFPISNPSELAEAKAKDIIEWTNGDGLVVTGSPSEPVLLFGTEFYIGQANNALLYPGLGLGIVASKAKKVTNNMLLAAAHSISEQQDLLKKGSSLLPNITQVKACSYGVAKSVFQAAIEDGVTEFSSDEIENLIKETLWQAKY